MELFILYYIYLHTFFGEIPVNVPLEEPVLVTELVGK